MQSDKNSRVLAAPKKVGQFVSNALPSSNKSAAKNAGSLAGTLTTAMAAVKAAQAILPKTPMGSSKQPQVFLVPPKQSTVGKLAGNKLVRLGVVAGAAYLMLHPKGQALVQKWAAKAPAPVQDRVSQFQSSVEQFKNRSSTAVSQLKSNTQDAASDVADAARDSAKQATTSSKSSTSSPDIPARVTASGRTTL